MWTSPVSHSTQPTGSYATSLPTVVNYPNTSSTTIYINPPTAVPTATSASYASSSISSSYAITASNLLGFVPSPSSSWASQSLSASYAVTASSADAFELRQYIAFNATTSVSHSEGRVFYDNTTHTLCVYNDRSNITLNVGEEQWIRVVNKTGTTITNGTPVTISGSQGNRPKAILAQSHNNVSEHKDFDIVGVATEDILNNEEGIVTTLGVVRSIDTSNWSTGDTLYVSSSAGQITNVRPSFPYDVIKVGISLNSTNNGSILVLPEEAIHTNDISGDGQLFVTASWSTSSISSSYASIAADVRPNITTLTSNTVLNNTHNNVLVSCSVSSIYISLPSASLNSQRLFNIKKIDNTGYNVVVQTVDSSSIDDTTYKIISTQYTNLTVQSNGSQYYIL